MKPLRTLCTSVHNYWLLYTDYKNRMVKKAITLQVSAVSEEGGQL